MYNLTHTNVYSICYIQNVFYCGLQKKTNPYSFEIKLKKWINNDRIVILFSPVSPCTIEKKRKYNNYFRLSCIETARNLFVAFPVCLIFPSYSSSLRHDNWARKSCSDVENCPIILSSRGEARYIKARDDRCWVEKGTQHSSRLSFGWCGHLRLIKNPVVNHKFTYIFQSAQYEVHTIGSWM